jgi:hypothetical protein
MQGSNTLTHKSSNPYRWPRRLALGGIFVPFGTSFIAALLLRRPQCPNDVTQAQIDAGNCIIGADMSLVLVFLAIPLVLLFVLAAAVWAGIIWYKRRRHNS